MTKATLHRMRASAWLRGLVGSVLGACAIAAFYDAAELHGGYQHSREGIRYVPQGELVFLLWYLVWGGLAVACFACALYAFGGARWVRVYDVLARRATETLVILALPLFLGVIGLRHWLLLDQPVSDDEPAYQLTARLLALGHVTQVPPLDAEFLRNQFVVIDAQRWHGKYPIGHSLLLAPFELLGRADLLGALLAVASACC
ncbi:MAG: hypothetical protein ABW321_25500, partial [Polyangiales bacterium]